VNKRKVGFAYAEYLRTIAKKADSPFYLFSGSEFLLQEECLLELRRALGEGWTYRSFRGDESENGLERLVDEARTPDFFSAKKLLYLRGAGDVPERELAPLADYLDEPVKDCIICISLGSMKKKSPGAKGGAGGKITTTLKRLAKEKGVLVDLVPLKEWELAKLVPQLAKARGLQVNDEASHYLAVSCGLEPRFLRDELDKLSLFFGASEDKPQAIDIVQLRQYVHDMRKGSSFDLVDHMGNRRLAAALGELSHLGLASGEAVMLVGLIAHRYRQLRLISAAKEKRLQEAELLDYLGMSPKQGWLIKRHIGQAAKYRGEEFLGILESLLAVDRGLKSGSGKGKEENLFSSFIQNVV